MRSPVLRAYPPNTVACLDARPLFPARVQHASDLCSWPVQLRSSLRGSRPARGSAVSGPGPEGLAEPARWAAVCRGWSSAPGARRAQGVPSRGAWALASPPASAASPSLAAGIRVACCLGCCVTIRQNEAQGACGLAPGSFTVSQQQFCSVYVGQKNKKQGWLNILFLFHVLSFQH